MIRKHYPILITLSISILYLAIQYYIDYLNEKESSDYNDSLVFILLVNLIGLSFNILKSIERTSYQNFTNNPNISDDFKEINENIPKINLFNRKYRNIYIEEYEDKISALNKEIKELSEGRLYTGDFEPKPLKTLRSKPEGFLYSLSFASIKWWKSPQGIDNFNENIERAKDVEIRRIFVRHDNYKNNEIEFKKIMDEMKRNGIKVRTIEDDMRKTTVSGLDIGHYLFCYLF